MTSSSTTGTSKVKQAALGVLVSLCILFVSIQFDNKGQMHPIWSYPYFSGASNLDQSDLWVYSQDGYDEIEQLLTNPSFEEVLQDYRYDARTDLKTFHLNDMGYVYIIKLAKTVFPFLSDMNAVEWLQILFHLFSSIFLFRVFKSGWQKFLFIFLYACNPLVISYVTYPFYYYWQAIPALFLIPYLVKQKHSYAWALVPIAFLLGLSIATRPTVLFLSLLLLGYFARKERKLIVALSLMVMLASAFLMRGKEILKSPWHTAYISIGAYENPDGLVFKDIEAEDYYFQETGERVNPDLPDGKLLDRAEYRKYSFVVQEGYRNFLKKHPLRLVRNGTLNVLQSFSFGYFEYRDLRYSYLSALLGFLFIVFLIFTRSWAFLFAIGIAAIGFTPYTPPVTRYLFGSFPLIICAAIVGLSRINEYRDR